jgi:hypothetical protein
MIVYSWRKALLRLQYEEQQSKAFACSRKINLILEYNYVTILIGQTDDANNVGSCAYINTAILDRHSDSN